MRSRRRTGGGAALLFAVSLVLTAAPGPSSAARPLPFSPSFEARVEETFFEDRRVSPERVERYRAGLIQRREQVFAVFRADQRARGRGKKASRRRAARRKVVRMYDLVIGTEDSTGWLHALLEEPDPVRSRRLAARILEVDYALLTEGLPPFSKQLPEHLTALSLAYWSLDGSTRARKADREASNLVDPDGGGFLEPAEIRRIVEQGGDLSRLDPPADSTFWRDPGVVASRPVASTYYEEGPPVYRGLDMSFPEEVVLKRVRKTQTKPKFEVEMEVGGVERRYKLKVGAEINSEPVTGALLTLLGFNADVVKHVKDYRIDLGDLSEEEIRREWRSYFEFKRLHLAYSFDDYFDVHHDESGSYMIAKEGSLTSYNPAVTRVGPWPWGALGNESLREVRGLSVFNLWVGNSDVKEAENNKLLMRHGADGDELHHMVHDLGHSFGRVFGEQLQTFPADLVVADRKQRIRFDYKTAWLPTIRNQATFADARWALRLIAQLTRTQIEEAVALGGWPDAAGRLLVEKLVERRNQLVEAYDLVGEDTPSGPIALLPVDTKLTTDDGAVVDGRLTTGRFEGATREYANYMEELLGPVWEEIKLQATGAFQGVVGTIPAVVLNSQSTGLSKFVVLEVVVGLAREVEENPRPTGSEDFYLVTDRVRLGLRVGGGLIVRGSTTFWRGITLVHPAPTKREAHFARDTVLDVFLRRKVRAGDLPPEYVLVHESYLDGAIDAITEDLSGDVPPVGLRGRLARVQLDRSVVSRKGHDVRLWRDGSNFSRGELEAFLNLVFVHLPLARGTLDDGDLDGRLWTFSLSDLASSPGLSDAISQVVQENDFSGLEALVPAQPLASDFRRTGRSFWIPFVFGRSSGSRSDEVRIFDPVQPDRVAETIHQYRRSQDGFWAFLDWGESHRHTVRASVAPDARGKARRPGLVATWYQRDRDTFSHELGDAYLRFVNGVRGRGKALIPFEPALHTVNDRFGDLEVKVRAGYSHKAVRRLIELDRERFWRDLGWALGIRTSELDRHRRHLTQPGTPRRVRASVPARLRGPIARAERLLDDLDRAREASSESERLEHAARALSRASYRRGGWYDPTLIGVVHRQLGRKQVSIDAVIQPPPFVENGLVGRTPLRAHTHEKPHALAREPVELDPRCAAAQWEMLETLPSVDGGELRWPEAIAEGSPCDGSFGGFAR